MSCLRRLAVLVLAPLPAAAVAARLLGWWPCAEGCAGGGAYQRLAGVPVLWPALAAYLALIPLAWLAPRAGGVWAWLLAGVGTFFLAVAHALGLACPFCLTVHGLAIALALLLRPWPGRAGLAALLLGALGANAAFHHAPLPDLPPPAPAAAAARDAEGLEARAEAGRCRGRADAPATVEAVLDLQCARCAESWQAVATALAPAVQGGRARLVVRLAARPSHAAGRALARWAFAAALDSPAAHGRLVAELLGTREDLGPEEVLAAHPEALAGPAAVARILPAMLDRLVDRDQERIRALGPGPTPLLVLSRDGRVAAQWRPGGDLAAFAAGL